MICAPAGRPRFLGHTACHAIIAGMMKKRVPRAVLAVPAETWAVVRLGPAMRRARRAIRLRAARMGRAQIWAGRLRAGRMAPARIGRVSLAMSAGNGLRAVLAPRGQMVNQSYGAAVRHVRGQR